MNEPLVLIERDPQGYAVVTLNRPSAMNALSVALRTELAGAIDELAASPQVRVMILTGAGRAFTAGLDLKELGGAGGGRELLGGKVPDPVQALGRFAGPVIAAINGAAITGGFELALACDLRVVADEARLGLPEARLGLLAAAGGTQRMTRICGEATARRLILGAEAVQGAEAVALGLAQWRAPAAELQATASAIAERIAGLPGPALRESKRCIAAALDPRQDGYEVELDGSGALLALEETQARVRRFLDRDAS